jgi:hypothetical protein
MFVFDDPFSFVDVEAGDQRCGIFNRRATIGKLIAEVVLKSDKEDPRFYRHVRHWSRHPGRTSKL